MKWIREKAVKYLLGIVLVAMGFLITSELTIKTLFSEDPYNRVTFYDYDEGAEPFVELEADARELGVEIVVTAYWWNDSYMDFRVYGSEEALKQYSGMSGIEEGNYSSLFSQDYHVSMYSLEEFYVSGKDYVVTVYFVSEQNAKRVLPAEWILEHGFDDLYGSNVNVKEKAQKQMICVWLLLILALSLFTYYDCVSQKKSFFVRVSLGDSIGAIILKNVLMDAVFYLAIFFLAWTFAGQFTYVPENNIQFWVVYILLNTGNLLVYLLLLGYSFKEAFSSTLSAKELGISYTMRLLTLISVIVLSNTNITLVKEYLQVTEHHRFYSYYADAGQISSNYGLSDYAYLRLTDEKQTSLFLRKSDIENGGTYPVVMLNEGSAKWLFTQYPWLTAPEADADVLVLYPSGIQDVEELKTQVKVPTFGFEDTNCYQYEEYSKTIEVPGNSPFSCLTMEWAENPVLMIDYREHLEQYCDEVYYDDDMPVYFHNVFLINMPEDALDNGTLTLEEGLSFQVRSVYDQYLEDIAPYRAGFYWETMLLGVIGLLEICILLRSIRLEFEVNAAKYVIRRIFGETILQAYMDILFFTTLQCISGAILSKLILRTNASWKMCLGVAALVWCCEVFIIIARIIYMEHINFQKVLKGGAL